MKYLRIKSPLPIRLLPFLFVLVLISVPVMGSPTNARSGSTFVRTNLRKLIDIQNELILLGSTYRRWC